MATAAQTIDISRVVDECPFRPFHLRLIGLCWLVVLLDGFDVQGVSYVAPSMAAALHLNRSILGLVFSAGVFGLSLGSLLMGWLADRFGRKTIFICCTLLFGFGSLATGFATSIHSLAAARLITGIGLGGATPVAITLAADYCPKRLKSALVIVMYTGFAIGSSTSGVVATLLGRQHWRGVFYIGAGLPMVLAMILWFALPEWLGYLLKRGHVAEASRVLLHLDPECAANEHAVFAAADAPVGGFQPAALFSEGRMASTLLLWALFFTSLVALYAYINWIPTLLSDLGIPPAKVVAIASAGHLGGIAGGLLMARLLVNWRTFPVIAGGYLLAALGFLALFSAGNHYGVLLAVNLALGTCLLGTQYAVNAAAAHIYPRTMRGTGVGWAIGIGRLGGVLGPSLAGLLLSLGFLPAHLFGFGAFPAALAALTACGLSVARSSGLDFQGAE